jgi:hypothetical protein
LPLRSAGHGFTVRAAVIPTTLSLTDDLRHPLLLIPRDQIVSLAKTLLAHSDSSKLLRLRPRFHSVTVRWGGYAVAAAACGVRRGSAIVEALA